MATPTCMNHEDRVAVFTGTFFETGQSITVCAECLVSFSAAMVGAATGELSIDADPDAPGDVESDEPSGPTPDAEPESSGSPESSPDDTTPDHVEVEGTGSPEHNGASTATHELDDELTATPSE